MTVTTKRVAMIAHAFPPEGSAGSYRPLRFVRHLPKFGWEPTVIAAAKDQYERYDPGLVGLIPSEAEVIYVRSGDAWQSIQAARAKRIQRRGAETGAEYSLIHCSNGSSIRSILRQAVRTAEAWCYHPDMAMGWIRPATEAICRICVRKQSNVIWSTGGPWSSFLVAQRASRKTGVPYVLDFRDAWTITVSEFEARRPKWATRWDHRTLYGLLQGAHSVIFRYHTEAECYWRAYVGALEPSRVHIIPNGYEGPIEEFVMPKGNKCVVLYTGTLSSYRYDTLLEALCQFARSDPKRASEFRLVFVGEAAEALANEARTLGLSDLVEIKGPASFEECNRLQKQAHALLMLGRQPTIKGYELLAGAKLFSYLKSGRPIIGILPRDETRKILSGVGVSTIADVDSPEEIVAVLRRLLDAWSSGRLRSLVPDRTACEAYSAERQTAAVVRALEGMPATDPFVPGRHEIPSSFRTDIENRKWMNVG